MPVTLGESRLREVMSWPEPARFDRRLVKIRIINRIFGGDLLMSLSERDQERLLLDSMLHLVLSNDPSLCPV